MADKEATVYIVDVGRSMGETHHGRTQTDLEWAMTWVWDKITSVVATERKTLLQGVIALKSNDTKNDLGHEESYQNLSVLHELSQILLPDLKNLQRDIKPSGTNEGDAISALALALVLIDKTCKKLKYRRNVILITNGEGDMDASDLDEISKKIVQDGVNLTVLGVDFDDDDFGKEEDKDPNKRKNEGVLRQFAADCDGAFGTIAQAVNELGEPRLKETKPVPSYRGQLTLGDPLHYPDTAVAIEVERYPRTMIRRPQTASSYVVAGPGSAPAAGEAMSGDLKMGGMDEDDEEAKEGMVQVRNQVSYFVEDPDAPDGKLQVERDDLARGYEYGRTAVHMNEADEGVTKLQTDMGLEIIGFVPWANYERYMSMSNAHVIIASKANSKAILALSSFIHALHELESFAITRLVTKSGREPTVELLAPLIEPDFECLLNVNLPFAEDVRSYKFPPLDKVVTVSGKSLKEHRFLPNDKLIDAMDEYIDNMDLSNFGQDDDGNAEEYLTLQDSFSPVLHYIDQAVRWRAVHPDGSIPQPYESLVRYRNPPDALLQEAKRGLDRLAAAADVKKVPPKVAGRRRKETPKPLSGLDVNALLDKKKVLSVDPDNPIPSLRQMLDNADKEDIIRQAAQQMGAIVTKRIQDSYGDNAYEQAIEEMTALRDEMKEMEEPGLWNDFVKGLKKQLLDGEIGEGRDEFWFLIRRARLGLLEGRSPNGDQITEEEATAFLRPRWNV